MDEADPPTGSKSRRGSHFASGPARHAALISVLLAAGIVGWYSYATVRAFSPPRAGGWRATSANLHWIPTILSSLPRNFGLFLMVAGIVALMAIPGDFLLGLFRIRWITPIERLAFSLGIGLAGWIPIVLLAGWAVDLRPVTTLVCGGLYVAVPLGISISQQRYRLPALRGTRDALKAAVMRPSRILLVLAVFALLYVALLGALSPEVQYDARWYHIGQAVHYVQRGHFYNMVAATHDPAMGLNPYQEILYTAFTSIDGPQMAKLFAFMDLPIIFMSVVAFGSVHLRSTRQGLAAAMMVTAVPIVSWSAATASNDLPVALYTLLAVHMLLRWCSEPRSWPVLYLSLVMAAVCCGVKAFGLLTLGSCLAVAAVWAVGNRVLTGWRDGIRRLVTGGSFVALACLPWLLRDGLMTGDPVFPLAYQIFPTEYWNQYATASATSIYHHVSVWTFPFGFVAALFHANVDPDGYRAIIGPVFLAGVPVTAALVLWSRRRPQPAWIICGVIGVIWTAGWYAEGLPTSRYLVGIMPVVCLWMVGGISLAWHSSHRPRIVPGLALGGVAVMSAATLQLFTPMERGTPTNGVTPYAWQYLYGHESPTDLLLRYAPMVQYVNQNLDAKTAKIYDAAALDDLYMYIRPEVYNGTTYGSPGTMRQWSLASPDALRHMEANRITHVVVDPKLDPNLSSWPIWHYLAQVYRSSDGLVLYRLRLPAGPPFHPGAAPGNIAAARPSLKGPTATG